MFCFLLLVRSISYASQKLVQAFPKLSTILQAENLATAFLQLEPRKRISAKDALRHGFFIDLPAKLYQLPDRKCFSCLFLT